MPASINPGIPTLYQGMSKAEVHKVWGEPNSVAIAGQPQFQNERWTYVKEGGVSRIYFESGVVQGWELP
jgi:outer membrane protein assembly factor BamE (lipoprotein component of BamABCDE complex)